MGVLCATVSARIVDACLMRSAGETDDLGVMQAWQPKYLLLPVRIVDVRLLRNTGSSIYRFGPRVAVCVLGVGRRNK